MWTLGMSKTSTSINETLWKLAKNYNQSGYACFTIDKTWNQYDAFGERTHDYNISNHFMSKMFLFFHINLLIYVLLHT